jgi:hypothetical protein
VPSSPRDKSATRTSAKGGSQIWLSEAKALLAEGYGGASRQAEKLLLDELAAGRLPWGSLLQKGEASDDFWKSGPRVNFEENSASNAPKVRMFYVGGGIDRSDPPRSSEHFGVWLSRPHVLALLPEPAPSASAPAATPAPLPSAPQRKPLTGKELRECILAIKEERPDDPPSRDDLREEVENRLNWAVGRDRVENLRKKVAPQWVKPKGRPRKSAK